ncbi:MAG: hypothetical protein ABSF47_03965 [Minisyncoccia bacterium]|jgi:hypothetical protein
MRIINRAKIFKNRIAAVFVSIISLLIFTNSAFHEFFPFLSDSAKQEISEYKIPLSMSEPQFYSGGYELRTANNTEMKTIEVKKTNHLTFSAGSSPIITAAEVFVISIQKES